MEMVTRLEPNMENVIGTDVKLGNENVGKVISYDKETGKATIQINSQEWAEKIVNKMQSPYGSTSSKNLPSDYWNIVGNNRTRIKFIVPVGDTKKWWQIWK